MLNRAREVEVNEATLTTVVALLLLAFGFIFYVGARVGGDVARRAAGQPSSTTAMQVGIGPHERPPLPKGFIGPPGPPYPPPVDVDPQVASRVFSVEVAVVADQKEANEWKNRLLERSFPAYVVTDPSSRTQRIRVGDYATLSEAETVARMVGKRDGFVGTVIPPKTP